MFIFDWIYDLVVVVSLIVTGASIVAAATPSPKDDEWIGKLLKFVDVIALNFNKKK
jgi:hypothetical protein